MNVTKFVPEVVTPPAKYNILGLEQEEYNYIVSGLALLTASPRSVTNSYHQGAVKLYEALHESK